MSEKEVDLMDLPTRCERIRALDKMERSIGEERKRRYYAGLSDEEHSELWNMVIADRGEHFV